MPLGKFSATKYLGLPYLNATSSLNFMMKNRWSSSTPTKSTSRLVHTEVAVAITWEQYILHSNIQIPTRLWPEWTTWTHTHYHGWMMHGHDIFLIGFLFPLAEGSKKWAGVLKLMFIQLDGLNSAVGCSWVLGMVWDLGVQRHSHHGPVAVALYY
jgi:hypothetical protein